MVVLDQAKATQGKLNFYIFEFVRPKGEVDMVGWIRPGSPMGKFYNSKCILGHQGEVDTGIEARGYLLMNQAIRGGQRAWNGYSVAR